MQCSITDAVNYGYIEPLVICGSVQHYGSQFLWPTPLNLLNLGSTGTGTCPWAIITFKVKNKSAIKGITFYTNQNWSSTYDGLQVHVHSSDYKISTQPIQ